jgi:hypothetical protein
MAGKAGRAGRGVKSERLKVRKETGNEVKMQVIGHGQ